MIGYIYKIISPSTDKIYIGSTTQTIRRRLSGHKGDVKNGRKCNSKLILSFNDANIELLEEMTFIDKKDLLKRERYHIELNIDKCVNKNIPTNTREEIGYTDKMRQQNRLLYLKKKDTKIVCSCGSSITYQNMPRHLKSVKHLICDSEAKD